MLNLINYFSQYLLHVPVSNPKAHLQEDRCNKYRSGIIYVYMYGTAWCIKCGFAGIAIKVVISYIGINCFYTVIFKFKNTILVFLLTPFIAIPAKPHFDEPGCTIHVHIYYTHLYFLQLSS